MKSTRRKSRRIPFESDVLQVVGNNDEYIARALDLSQSGMRLRLGGRHAQSGIRHAWLKFRLPNGAKINALGEMRHEYAAAIGGQVLGFRFKYISPRDRAVLNDFMLKDDSLNRSLWSTL